MPLHIAIGSDGRVHAANGLSVALHTVVLAGWRPSAVAPPKLPAFEPIAVARVGTRPARRPPRGCATAAPLPATAAEGRGAETPEPLVKARADVATLNNPGPPYSLTARRHGIEGRVLLAVHVRADGTRAEVRLKHSSGPRRAQPEGARHRAPLAPSARAPRCAGGGLVGGRTRALAARRLTNLFIVP